MNTRDNHYRIRYDTGKSGQLRLRGKFLPQTGTRETRLEQPDQAQGNALPLPLALHCPQLRFMHCPPDA
jgi:hypothetical protein